MLRRGRLTVWRRHVDRPRDRLVQVTLMSTVDHLARWRLVTRLNWLNVINVGRIMLNRDRRVRCFFTRKVDRFWNLTISDLPTSWNFGVGLNGFVGLTAHRIALNCLTILINVIDMGSLTVSRVVNRNIGQLGISGWVINAGNRFLTWGVTRNFRSTNRGQAVLVKYPWRVGCNPGNLIGLASPLEGSSLVNHLWLFTRLINGDCPRNALVKLCRIGYWIQLWRYLNGDSWVVIRDLDFTRNFLTRY